LVDQKDLKWIPAAAEGVVTNKLEGGRRFRPKEKDRAIKKGKA